MPSATLTGAAVGRDASCNVWTYARRPYNAVSVQAGNEDGEAKALIPCGGTAAANVDAIAGSMSAQSVETRGSLMQKPEEGLKEDERISQSQRRWRLEENHCEILLIVFCKRWPCTTNYPKEVFAFIDNIASQIYQTDYSVVLSAHYTRDLSRPNSCGLASCTTGGMGGDNHIPAFSFDKRNDKSLTHESCVSCGSVCSGI